MTTTLLIVLTVVEILALVAVLAIYLWVIARRLRSICETLAQMEAGVGAISEQLVQTGTGVGGVNWELEQLADALPALLSKAEALGR